MTWTSLENFFTPTITPEIAAEWRDRPVVTGPDAFTSCDEDERYIEKTLALPYLNKGGKEIRTWAWDSAENVAVVKCGYGWDGGTPLKTACREKLFADLGRALSLPIPPARLWGESGWRIYKKAFTPYRLASLRAFPNSQDSPPDELLLKDFSLAQMAVFGQWIIHPDQHKEQIVYDASLAPAKAYVDFGLANWHDCSPPSPFRLFPFFGPMKMTISEAVRRIVGNQVAEGIPAVEQTVRAIESLPDSVIKDSVDRLPEPAFNGVRDIQGIKDRLLARRDNLRPLIRAAIALGI